MSFFDDSTLAFLPSGGAGKDGKAYSIKPTNGTGDFTFSRGSNLTATRINASGLIEKGRENLFLNSDTPATQSITIANGSVYVFSFLGTGSVVATGGTSFTLNGTGALDRVQNYFVASSTSVTLTISGTISEPQLELGTAATSYIETDASSALGGLLEDSPRFDYSGGASCPSLLLEPSRTNEIGYSEYFEGWTPQGSPTITSNFGTSPEGLQNSSRLVFTNGSDYIETSVTNTSGVFTIYAKGTGNIILTDSGANDSITTALTSSYQRIELYFSTNTTTLQIKTDGSGLDAEVFGAQFENATYPTSYIPNHSSGSATRGADSSTITSGLSIGNGTEFGLYYEIDVDAIPRNSSSPFIQIQFSDASGGIGIKGASDAISNYIDLYGTTDFSESFSARSMGNGIIKFFINYSSGTGDFYLNGTKYTGAISGPTSGCEIDSVYLLGSAYKLKAKQILIFPESLSEDDCITLTT